MRLDTANLYTIDGLWHHACRKAHGLERVMSELGHMGCAGGRCGCIHLWVLSLLHSILTHLIPRCGGLEGLAAVVVLNARCEHGHGGVWSVGHEADVVWGLLLLGGLLLGGKKVGGIDGYLSELRNVLLWTQNVGGRTNVHDSWRGVGRGERGDTNEKSGEEGVTEEMRARLAKGRVKGREREGEGAVAAGGRSRRRSGLRAGTRAG